ncbi:magnesium and cobalt transport protein CorA [Cellulomonas sp. DKR-3]|uniref:Magnesium and cobalt transport protein CorA n=2 Tax=Cellulomonas fulva TaxID=2835530 RepID=A0ABS5U1G6_9CELL|nr:magnesium and cobalt transport protein CorA [Cellulomonas fulva]
MPTVSYAEASRDVHTGILTCLVTQDVVIACESGDAHVLRRAAARLCDGLPFPDEGVRQVLAAVLLTLVSQASDVEAGLGDAVAETEQLVFSSRGSGGQLLGSIYGLKREIAEARRALGPITTAMPELEAETREVEGTGLFRRSTGAPATVTWLRRVRDRSDRVDRHLDAHDDLLDAMLSVHLSQVSVRQNEDMRKMSAWAAMIAVPTLIAGVYGMNFRHMPELDWTLGYPLVLAVMAGACGLLYRAFRRSGWL